MRKFLIFLSLIAVLFTACAKKIYVPIEKEVFVHTKDSIYLRDTTIQYKIEKEYLRDYTGLLDTLRLSTNYSDFMAFVDTTNNLLKGEAKNKEKTVDVPAQVESKVQYRDSIIYQDRPVPVEVEKIVKVVPWYAKILSGLGIIFLILLALWAGKKLL